MRASKREFGRRAGTAALALVLALPTAQAVQAAPSPSTGITSPQPSVTLITGDRVTIMGEGVSSIEPAKGREGIAFSTRRKGDHLYVIPQDTVQLVAAGRLDERLFDVTTLLRSGYDDASRKDLPLIVIYGPGSRGAPLSGASITLDLPSVNGAAVTVDKAQTGTLLKSSAVQKIWLDGIRTSTLDRSTAQIGAPVAWQAGLNGAGVKVAVLDTGVDQTHPDLAGRQIAERNFSNAADNVDRHGHGTHVASTIAGNGAKYGGVAPGAQILDGKVLNNGGQGQESWIIAGMQWAAQEGAKIVNLSLGGDDTPGIDPLEEAVNTLSAAHGTLFVIAAGNSGPGNRSVGSPGSADAALTVGAVGRDESLASFSSRGPRVGDSGLKPDITAPGVGIVAAKATNGSMGTPVESGYVAASGTSMATPHVAGAAAILAQQHPDWTGPQLKAALTASASPNSALTAFEQGSGRVDVAKAIAQAVTSEPTNVSLGLQLWPHSDDKPITKTVTYRNSGPAAVTLSLAVQSNAPAGMLGLSAATVTVPAGGSSTVDVTGDTRVGTKDGVFSGQIVATGGGMTVRTPIGVEREAESYTVTLNHIGLDGLPAPDGYTYLVSLQDVSSQYVFDVEDGTSTVRLPAGKYTLDGTLFVNDEYHWLSYPGFVLSKDTVVDMDFRKARPIDILPPDPTADGDIGQLEYLYVTDGAIIGNGWVFLGGDLSRMSSAHLGPKMSKDQFTVLLNTQWEVPVSKDYYGLTWYEYGAMPTGYVQRPTKEKLAKVHSVYKGPVPQDEGTWLSGVAPLPKKGAAPAAWVATQSMAFPGKRTEYYTTEGVRWTSSVYLYCCLFLLWQVFTGPVKEYDRGRTYEEPWNQGPFGPAFPSARYASYYVNRWEDNLYVTVPLFADSMGNITGLGVDTAKIALYRDGVKLGEKLQSWSNTFTVPGDRGTYTLTAEGTRSTWYDTATRASATWTFRSSHVDGEDYVKMDVSTIRYSPQLDADNAAPAGRHFLVPVAVVPQGTDSPEHVRRLRVEVSYDSGATWSRATVLADRFILLRHPDAAGTVSLRTKATDWDGSTVEQTIIDAYKLTKG